MRTFSSANSCARHSIKITSASLLSGLWRYAMRRMLRSSEVEVHAAQRLAPALERTRRRARRLRPHQMHPGH